MKTWFKILFKKMYVNKYRTYMVLELQRELDEIIHQINLAAPIHCYENRAAQERAIRSTSCLKDDVAKIDDLYANIQLLKQTKFTVGELNKICEIYKGYRVEDVKRNWKNRTKDLDRMDYLNYQAQTFDNCPLSHYPTR